MFETLFEGLVLTLILGIVTFLSGRSLYRTMKGDSPGCRCSENRCCVPRPDGATNACPTVGLSHKENVKWACWKR